MFVTDDQVLADIAAVLKKDQSALSSYWSTIVGLGHPRAYDDLVATLLARGYLIADIYSWGAGPGAVYERALALFYCLSDGGGLDGYDDRFIKQFDCRKQVERIQIFDPAGNPIPTETGALGTSGFGQLDAQQVRGPSDHHLDGRAGGW